MKRLVATVMVIVLGLSVIVPDIYAQSASQARKAKRQEKVEAWKRDMQKFRQKVETDKQIHNLVDSIASIQAITSVQNRDFVLQINSITFPNGRTVLVTSTTNFIYVKGDRAVVQISPSDFAPGPNGVGGVTVDGAISSYKMITDNKGRLNLSYNVSGIGINAQIEVFIVPGTTTAQAAVYPNFNSNTIWVSGTIIPYDNADIFEGSSL